MDEPGGLVGVFNHLFGGAATSLIGAGLGRLMYHTTQVRAKRRRFFGWDLLWELPVATGMAIIGEGLAGWLGLTAPVSTGLIAAMSYLGPKGIEAHLEAWVAGKKKRGE